MQMFGELIALVWLKCVAIFFFLFFRNTLLSLCFSSVSVAATANLCLGAISKRWQIIKMNDKCFWQPVVHNMLTQSRTKDLYRFNICWTCNIPKNLIININNDAEGQCCVNFSFFCVFYELTQYNRALICCQQKPLHPSHMWASLSAMEAALTPLGRWVNIKIHKFKFHKEIRTINIVHRHTHPHSMCAYINK